MYKKYRDIVYIFVISYQEGNFYYRPALITTVLDQQKRLTVQCKKGSTLLAKVRDIIASHNDSRTGCNLYTILAHYTD